MKLDVTRMEVWVVSLKDQPGALAGKLETLQDSGVNLEFLLARRAAEKSGRGVVFASPIKGAKQLAAAKKAGFKKSKSIQGVRISATDKPGLVQKLTQPLADADISLRGLSAAATGRRAVIHIAFDSAADASKAVRILKKL